MMDERMMPTDEELLREANSLKRLGPLAMLDIARQFLEDDSDAFEHFTSNLIDDMNPDVARGMVLGWFMVALVTGPQWVELIQGTQQGSALVTTFRAAVTYCRAKGADLSKMEEFETAKWREFTDAD